MHVVMELQKQFGLSDNEVKLLALLKEGSFSVKRLSRASKVPMGRIYSVLQELEEKGLVVHRGNPRTYTSKPWDERVSEFLDRENQRLVYRKQSILEALSTEARPYVHIITNMAQYKSQYVSWISGADYCYHIDVGTAYPLIFLDQDEEESLRILQAVTP
ncbi:MAG: helix-turn-helix domain-containing protein, partial [archaeon]|nr:helix-turn-helix domain-containing protein [archaeon]